MMHNRSFSLALSGAIVLAAAVSSAPVWCEEAVKTNSEYKADLVKLEAQLAKRPSDVELLCQHAELMGQLEQYDAQLSESKVLSKKYPNLRRAHKSLAYSFFGLKRPAEALTALNAAFALGAPSTSEVVQRAILLNNLGRYADALKDLNIVLKDHPNDEDAHFLRAECYFHMYGSCKLAVSDLEQTLKINPSRNDARKLLVFMNKEISAGSIVK